MPLLEPATSRRQKAALEVEDRPAFVRELEPAPTPAFDHRPEARGKFLFVGDTKYWVKGVTYGTFAPGQDGYQIPDRDSVERDLR